MNEAIQLRDQEKFDEAIAYLKCLQVDHPRNPDVEYQIGWTYDASKEYFCNTDLN